MSRGQGARLKLNPAGVWEIRWSDSGVTKRVSTRTASRPEAERVFAGFLLERGRQEDRGEVLTVDQILDLYWEKHVDPNVIDKDRIKYAMVPLRAHFSDTPADEVDSDDVDAYCEARRDGSLGNEVGDATIRKELGVLVSAIRCAIRRKRLDPKHAPFIELPAQPVARDRWLTEEEADALIAACPKMDGNRLSRIYRFVKLAIETASRKRALETLTWFQVDFERRLIQLNPSGRRQTKKRRPVVPISDELLPILKTAWDERVSEFVLDHAGAIRTSFETAVEKSKLADVSPHVLRHTWATWAAQRGVDLWKIAGVLGDTLGTVTRVYLHHCPEHLRDAVNRSPVGREATNGSPKTTDNAGQ